MRSSRSGYRPDGSLEFVGHFEERGWKLAGATVPITYIAWSLWLILSGFVFVVR